jgi:hypothetical protein
LAEQIGCTADELDQLIAELADLTTDSDSRIETLAATLNVAADDLSNAFALDLGSSHRPISGIDDVKNFSSLERVHRAFRLANLLSISMEDLYVLRHRLSFDIRDTAFEDLTQLHLAVTLPRQLDISVSEFADLLSHLTGGRLERALGFESGELALFILHPDVDTLADKTGTDSTTLNTMIEAHEYELGKATDLDWIRKRIGLANALDIPVLELDSLLDATDIRLKRNNSPEEIARLYRVCVTAGKSRLSFGQLADFDKWEHDLTDADVELLLEVLENAYDQESVLAVIADADKRIWSQERNALRAYAISSAITGAKPDALTTSLELGEHLLIDLENTEATTTSELKQAIESLQSFVLQMRTGHEAETYSHLADVTARELSSNKAVNERICDFVNTARRPEDIAGIEPQDGPVVDKDGRGYDIGETVAIYVIDKRNRKGVFTDPEELLSVPGFGADKLLDVRHSFGVANIDQVQNRVFNFYCEGFEERISLMEEQWRWMRSYVLWEAARKVFLFPENYITPQLRDNKTEFFKEMEEELGGTEATDEDIQKTIEGYVADLKKISSLSVSGCVVDEWRDRLHVFARSEVATNETYYRAFDEHGSLGGWQKLPENIVADRVYPIMAYKHLYLFWLETEKKEGEQDDTNEYKHKVSYCYRKATGDWSQATELCVIPDSTVERPSLVVNFGTQSSRQQPLPFQTIPGEVRAAFGIFSGAVTRSFEFTVPEDYEIDEVILKPWVSNGADTSSHVECITDLDDLRGKAGDQKIEIRLKGCCETVKCKIKVRVIPGNWRRENVLTVESEAFEDPDRYAYEISCSDKKRKVSTASYDDRVIEGDGFGIDGDGQFSYNKSNTNALVALSSMEEEIAIIYLNGSGVESSLDYILTGVPERVSEESDTNKDTYNVSTQDSGTLLTLNVDEDTRFEACGKIGDTSCFFVSTKNRDLLIRAEARDENLQSGNGRLLRFHIEDVNYRHYCRVADKLRFGGADDLLATEFQSGELDRFSFKKTFGCDNDNVFEVPSKSLDFDGPNGLYNWELFFHIPHLIADELHGHRQFERAVKWYQFIVDPDMSGERAVWQFSPFISEETEALAEYVDDVREIMTWRSEPFNPNAIARMRPGTYKRSLLLSYVDNILEWGDKEFAIDTRETVNRARGLYVLADKILHLEEIAPATSVDNIKKSILAIVTVAAPRNTGLVAQLEAFLEDLSARDVRELLRCIVDIVTGEYRQDVVESTIVELLKRWLPKSRKPVAATISRMDVLSRLAAQYGMDEHEATSDVCHLQLYGGQSQPYQLEYSKQSELLRGCIPSNPQQREYDFRIRASLQKLRSGRNIAGVQRVLPIYEASIDPMVGVRAVGVGGGVDSVNFTSAAGIGPYRFSYLCERAKSLAKLVVQTSSALLASLEKKEAEELAYLQARHGLKLAKANVHLKKLGLLEAEDELLRVSMEIDQLGAKKSRLESLVSNGLSDYESGALTHLQNAEGWLRAAQIAHLVSAAIAMYEFEAGLSGPTWAPDLSAAAGGIAWGFGRQAQLEQNISSIQSIHASFQRRAEEWQMQLSDVEAEAALAAKDEELASERVAIASWEQEVAGMQADNADQVVEFLNDKFTNRELYAWMARTLSKINAGFYNLAYSTARMAQATMEFERNESSEFVQYGYWDSEKKGLLAGDKLLMDISRMEEHYLAGNNRKLELTKNISLAAMAPESLNELIRTGRASFSTPMSWFDRDFPGHYQRIIKSARVTVVAPIPPATGICATLSTAGPSRVLLDPARPDLTAVSRYQQVALTASSNATGMFELSYRDDRYLPFEDCGVDVTWELEMPKPSNRFDFDNIVDVILTIDYTALADSEYKKKVIDALGTEAGGMVPLIIRAIYPKQWETFRDTSWATNGEESGNGVVDPYTLKFKVTRGMFVPNEEEQSLESVAFGFGGNGNSFRIPLNVTFRSESGEVMELNGRQTDDQGQLRIREAGGMSPFGNWEIAVDPDRAPQQLRARDADGAWITENVSDPGSERYLLDMEKIESAVLLMTYSSKVTWPPLESVN